MTEQLTLDHALIQQWIAGNLSEEAVIAQIESTGLSPAIMDLYLQGFKKMRDEKRYKNGMALIISGAILGFFSCVASLCNIAPEYCTLILVGLTSVSLVLVFIGLYLVFEK